MPGKVTSVICESIIKVDCRVIANDTAITCTGLEGSVQFSFELNVAMPVMADATIVSIQLLSRVSRVFFQKLLSSLELNRERCTEFIEQSLVMVTPLAPEIGYENAASLAKQAFNEGKTIRDLVLAKGLLVHSQLDRMLDPDRMTRPG